MVTTLRWSIGDRRTIILHDNVRLPVRAMSQRRLVANQPYNVRHGNPILLATTRNRNVITTRN